MLTAINRFELSRSIPAEIARKIRQNSGFGCVICGLGIWEYEHVEPSWVDAESHDPSNMTLLCSQCHTKKTRRMLSVSTIRTAMANPKSKQNGFSNEFFDFNDEHPFIDFGGTRMENITIPIQVNGDPLFEIQPPEEPGAPFQLSGQFYDSNGGKSLFILKNEWRAFNENWDVEVTGPTINIRERAGKISLIIRAVPPNGIVIERLQMKYQQWDLNAGKDYFKVNNMTFIGGGLKDGHIGLVLG